MIENAELYSISKGKTIAFGFGAFTDQMSHQAFQFLIFTFYYAVVGVHLSILALGFVLFAIWDSINDPIIGVLSDRTHTRVGRRRFWVLISLVPFALLNVILFYPPFAGGWRDGFYMIMMIMLYDLFYSMFSTNQTSLFPEMFKTERARGRANLYKNILTVIGVLIGFVLPTLLISPMAPVESTPPEVKNKIPIMYQNTGLLIGVLVLVIGFCFYKFGMHEDSQQLTRPETMPHMWTSLKQTFKNKIFILFVIANLFQWFTFKMLTTIIPLYGIHVLGITEGNIMLSLLLLVALLSAMAFFPLMEKIGLKYGMRNGFMFSCTVWILALIPFAFLDNQPVIAIFCMIPMGVGLSGSMFFVDIIIASIIDEDEVQNGQRREGSYYGVNALINRYSTILVFVAISVVLSGYGWAEYLVGAGLDYAGLREGLKILLVGFNIGGLLIVILCLKIFPLHGQRWRDVQEKLKEKRAAQK
jgi:GPH family glycoside/pentoside/hexuronide:cation symporter